MSSDRRRRIAATALAVLGLGVMAAPALAGEACAWKKTTIIYHDPQFARQSGQSSFNDARTNSWWNSVTNEEVSAGESVPTWAYEITVDTGPWTIVGYGVAYSLSWGFSSVTVSQSAAAKWRIERIASCMQPSDDIEVDVRQQFTAVASLDADEVAEALGRMKFWCGNTPSSHHAGAILADAIGGVSVSASHSADDATVAVQAFGITVVAGASSGGSDEQTIDANDSGNNGKCPETVDTLTGAELTLDLDTLDDGVAQIRDAMWYASVIATCKGLCQRQQPMVTQNSYPPPSGE